MSVVDKMLIKGIRSFSPENTNVITFYRPLTLIVGPNGAGKTTIIECLKHACTGEMPPNSRSGHSFIHDPKVAGETETKGQIKLRFKTGAGKDVVCIRSFQLTQKGSKMEFKAIESVLQTINAHTGEKVCLSYRCADMDKEVPTLMGVSKAILENVIFVHQDDANWPLADAATLKKKFDDIFSATRYTKALEVIKKLHKDQAQEIKMYKLKLENLQNLKDAAYKLRENMDQDHQRAVHLRSLIHDLEMKITNSQKERQSLEASLEQLRLLQNQIDVREAKREMLVKLKAKQYQDLEEENDDTDEELANWQTQFQTEIGSLTLNISKLERELSDSDRKIQVLIENYSKDSQLKGRLQAELEVHTQQKHDRDQSIRAFFSRHNLGFPSLPLSNEVAVQHLETATNRLEVLTRDHETVEEDNRIKVASKWTEVERALERYSQAEGQLNAKREQKRGKTEEMRRLENMIRSGELAISERDLTRLDENLKKTKEEMEKRSTALSAGDFEAKISATKSELANVEEKLKVVQREKDDLASESMERTYLRSRKEDLVNKESNLNQILEGNKTKLSRVLKGGIPDPKDLKDEIDRAVSSQKQVVGQLNNRLVDAGNKVASVTSKLTEAKRNLANLQTERNSKKKQLVSKITIILQKDVEIDAFPDQLKAVKVEKEDKQKIHDQVEGMKQLYDPFETIARSQHMCACCERKFTPQEEDEFVKKQRSKRAGTDAVLHKYRIEKEDLANRLQNLEKLRAVYDECQKLGRDLIPEAEKTVEKSSAELESATVPYDDLVGLLAQANSELELVDSLRETADSVDRLYREISHLRKQVQDQEIKLDTRSQSFRTLDQVSTDLSVLQGKRDEINKLLERTREEYSHAKDEFAKWNMKYHNAREEHLNGHHALETLKKLRNDKTKVEEQLTDMETHIELLQDSLGPLLKVKDDAAKEHEALKKKVEKEDTEKSWELRKFKQEVHELQIVSSQIVAFITSGKEVKLNETNDRLSSSKAQQEAEERKKQEVAEELKQKKEMKINQGSVMRNIEENIQYRKTTREIQELDKEIVDLEKQMLDFGEKPKIEADMQRLVKSIQDLSSEQSRSQGTMTVYQTNVAKNKADLKQAQYKDIDNRYCGQLIQLKTTEMANKDLDKYYNALDKALMRFHSMKMEEINKIIKELWQQTYRGQDIDYIEIRSDAEGAGTRSYSYRVIMRSGDAELEMRGRCSAGQKVLASLIIRLALAETFCLNCGILALDEPTTNLDGPNAASLAEALVRIMQDRKGQENFQLIVITHDERFAQLIGHREHAEQYYRISKDDHQHSIIETQDIFD
ncbi:unnamed protein product [Calypogeia fissa]